ncbi:MAG: 2-hydroxyacyl-CoA dehydratase family protein, partial [Promethearchaeota archaeon]
MPKNMAKDTIDFKSYLQMAIDFFSGPEIMAKARNSGRKIGALTFPFPEIFIGGGLVPIFIPRLNKGRRYSTITATLAARNLLGMNTLTRSLSLLKNMDSSGTVINIAGNVINDIIFSLNETYENAVKEGVEAGIPIDHCYGAKALFGLYKKLGKEIDMNLGIDLRCSVFFNYHEALSINNFVSNNFILDMPYSDNVEAIDYYEAELWKLIDFQEKITKKRFDMNKFRDCIERSNKVKSIMKKVFLDISAGDILPCSPATFSELQSLLLYSQIDFNSRLIRYQGNIQDLLQEMYDRIDKRNTRFDATDYPKIIYTPIFGGFEPEIASIADDLGARVYYPDWIIYGGCEPIKTSGNLVRNYAEALIKFQHGLGFNNAEMANNIINVAKKIKADGIIFCEVFGCRSMCSAHRILRDIIK